MTAIKTDTTREYSISLDEQDPLKSFRSKFHMPKHTDGSDSIYLCGNSLGLMPKQTSDYVNQELKDWATYGVEGHFNAKFPWFSYHESLAAPMAKLVGAKPHEVVVMNSLTVNLHLLMVSFYRPTKKKFKILIDYHAFPSDRYMVASQARYHGYDEEGAIIELAPDSSGIVTENSINETVERHKDELALILIGGVNYYTGQAYDVQHLTSLAQKYDITLGLDLAHAAGNIQLELHDLGVDFAAWCTYKYLNSGPGAPSGVFIHEKHLSNKDIPRFEGWWGTEKKTRFLMEKTFTPMKSAESWQLSNPPIMALAGIRSSLDIFDQVSMEALTSKSKSLTSYLEALISTIVSPLIQNVSPKSDNDRGCQLSIHIKDNNKKVYDDITASGVICDWREPGVIRIAPVPLYNSHEDIYRFYEVLKTAVNS